MKARVPFVFFIFLFCMSLLQAHKFDYLLYSDVFSDVERGIEIGANANAIINNETPLCYAARKGNTQSAILLLGHNANVNVKCNSQTPLQKVVISKNLAIARIFLLAGAHVNEKDDIYGNTPLHYAVYNGDMAMVSLLMHYGADMSVLNNNNESPEHFLLSHINVPPLSIENSDIALTSSAFRLGGGGVTFNVRNLSDDAITIYYSALDINGNIIAGRRLKRTIAPNSTAHGIATLEFGSNALENIQVDNNGQAILQYGFNIQYVIGEDSGNLHDEKNIILQVWDPPAQVSSQTAANEGNSQMQTNGNNE